MKLPRIFHSKLFLGAVIIVLLAVFGLELSQWEQRRKIDSEISQLVAQQKDLEEHNKALEQSLQYFGSNSYQEKLAREQLGLKKDGEIVLNFPPNGIQSNTSKPTPKKSNPQKWWDYIFNNNS